MELSASDAVKTRRNYQMLSLHRAYNYAYNYYIKSQSEGGK